MILFCSNSGESLPIVYRLKREGTDARIYIHNPRYRKNYDGIVPKVKISELKKAVSKADIIVFDITRPNERSKQDIVFLKMFGLKASTPSVFGPVGDKLKKDHRVIGAGAVAEEIELDRHKGIELAGKMGFAIPEHHEFNSLSKGLKFLKGRKDLWVFKPENNQDLDLTYVEKFAGEIATKITDEWNARIGDKCEYILQKKIDGAEVSTEVWAGPRGPEHFNRTLEDKRLMTGNLGPAIGSQSNTVWREDDLSSVPEMFKMAAYLKTNNYIGPCDANLIISKNVPYFLEWTCRFGYDAIYCLFELLKGKLTDFFEKDFKVDFHKGYAASQRLSVPPFPYADKKLLLEFAKDVTVLGDLSKMPRFWAQDIYYKIDHLACAGADGILGIITGRGDSLGAAWGQVYGAIDKMKICSYLQFRPDGYKSAEKRLAQFNKESRRLKIA